MRLLKELFFQLLQKLKIFSKKHEEKTEIVLDTSALQSKKGMQILEVAEKVILLTGTIRELDKYKKDEGLLGTNIRIISRKSREDLNQEKYICTPGYENSQYQDDNIIEYCKKHKNAVILTGDNNLCNMSKAYNIVYIYVEPDVEIQQEVENVESVKAETEDIIKEKINPEERRQYIKGAFFEDNILFLHKTSWMTNNFVYRDSKLVREFKNPDIKLEKGDIVYQIRYEDAFVKVLKYEIDELQEKGYAKYLTHFNMDSVESIESKKDDIPIEAINQILRRSSNIKVHNTEVKVCLMDAILIRDGAKVDKNYKYQKGDRVYKIINVKNNKHLFIREYEIILNGDVYELIETNKSNIYYLNDIFRYNFPEVVEEEIRKAYLENINY